MSDIGLERNMQTELSPLPQQNSSASNYKSSIEPISSQSSVEDFLNNKLEIPFKSGDRVLVNGLKEGIVRFIGQADFARGVWVGVELKKATGKNDGSVAGKRYFQCPAMHGLFAPVHKVEVWRMPVRAPPQPRSRSNLGGSSVSKSNSQESLSSIKSAASSASQRMKLGVTSLTGQVYSFSSRGEPTLSSYQLQKILKEKEDLIEQLTKERDLERSEHIRTKAQFKKKILKLKEDEDRVTKLINIQRELEGPAYIETATQLDKLDHKCELMKSENNRSIAVFRQLEEQIMTIEGEKNDIKIQLMEEQRRNEETWVSLEKHEIKLKMHFEQSDTVVEKVEKVASRMETLRWRAKTAELDAKDLRNKQKQLKRKIHKLLQVQRDLIAENHKLRKAKQENKKETSSNEENQEVGLMSIGVGASLIESQIDFLNAEIESRLKIAESSKSMTDIDGTSQKPTTVRLLCDTCDVLDLHDTDDCPMQNTTSGPPDASLHHGNKDEEQPYCSSCKVFGHATDQCQDEQKY